jgi:hypothetical protein
MQKLSSGLYAPVLVFSTMLNLWRPDFALNVVSEAEKKYPSLRPSILKKGWINKSSTEAESYTLMLIQDICSYAFGEKVLNEYPRRKRIAVANVEWIRRNVKIGSGLDYSGLRGLIDLYTFSLNNDVGI